VKAMISFPGNVGRRLLCLAGRPALLPGPFAARVSEGQLTDDLRTGLGNAAYTLSALAGVQSFGPTVPVIAVGLL